MYIIQSRDLSEGMGALWSDDNYCEYPTHEDARKVLRAIRSLDERFGSDMISYRIVVKGSDYSYSQPTDRLEF